MRFRLVIPAAIAAVATYLALVRDEMATHTYGHRHDVPAPVPAPAQPTATAPPAPVAEPQPAPSVQPPAPPSQYIDLATPAPWDASTPSVYDLLAGEPTAISMTHPSTARETAPPVEPPVDDLWTSPAPVEAPAPAESPVAVEPPEPPPAVAPSQDLQAVTSADPVADTSIPLSDAPVVPSTPHMHEVPVQPTLDAEVLDEGRFALGGWAASAGHSMVSAVTFRHRLTEDVSANQILLHIDVADNIPDDGLIVLADPGFAPDHEGFTLLLAAAYPGPFSAAGSYRVVRNA